jgi:hypothetical protein
MAMDDNLQNRGNPDRTRINLSERWEVDYWIQELDVTEEDLRKAVEAVGPSAEKVKEQLRH